MTTNKEILLCKYGEIVLKGANKKYFEDVSERSGMGSSIFTGRRAPFTLSRKTGNAILTVCLMPPERCSVL